MPDINQQIFPLLRARLDARRYQHSLSVATTARDLAERYGVDPEAAYTAGLVHDWDKCLPDAELIARAQRYQVGPEGDLRELARLLHSVVGAEDLRCDLPGLSEEVLQAVARHTSAAPEMSDLDMVIYVADMVEPLRDNPELDALRLKIGKVSLQELFFSCLAYLIDYLVARRRLIAPNTLEVWNAYVRRQAAKD
ncbi:MAG: bis(5'-nucleosyl)-tetraphosphatase (symmetrical) YqeK [Coriobacteriales bacterium]|jgi:predicted HD superfamily hydrolase involved in NAD metabolism|nr:bis(5'-nucleosyl)-tetraphosphatase (symmetrical) YqeK [Coriobacteriales bacterium]